MYLVLKKLFVEYLCIILYHVIMYTMLVKPGEYPKDEILPNNIHESLFLTDNGDKVVVQRKQISSKVY